MESLPEIDKTKNTNVEETERRKSKRNSNPEPGFILIQAGLIYSFICTYLYLFIKKWQLDTS